MFKKLSAKRNQKGFTLIEMLIVVAIIAILVAIAVPTFSSQLDKSRLAVDQSNLRSAMSLAVADYMLEHQDEDSVTFSVSKDANGNLVVEDINAEDTDSCKGKCTDDTEVKPTSAALKDKGALTITVENGAVRGNSWAVNPATMK